MLRLIEPGHEHLASYVSALERGWSPNNMDVERHRLRELKEIADDPDLFLAQMTDRDASAGDVELPDGSFVKRIPGIRRWIWDGEFCGSIGFRWQPGTEELPPHLLGHIGFAVVPWKRGNGLAAFATREILPEARALGMRWVTITADADNPASRRSIENAGGYHIGTREKPAAYQDGETVEWFRIDL